MKKINFIVFKNKERKGKREKMNAKFSVFDFYNEFVSYEATACLSNERIVSRTLDDYVGVKITS